MPFLRGRKDRCRAERTDTLYTRVVDNEFTLVSEGFREAYKFVIPDIFRPIEVVFVNLGWMGLTNNTLNQ